MSGRVWSLVLVFGRGWLFGALVGLVLGGGIGTFYVPVVGTVYGGVIGSTLGAIVGPVAGALVAPAALLPPSVVADRVWPSVVATVLTYLLCTEVVFSGTNGWSGWSVGDSSALAALACVAGALSACFGPTVVRGVRTRLPRASHLGVVGAVAGGLTAAGRFVAIEGWSEPFLFVALTMGGLVAGGILSLTLIAYNLLVTKEPATA